MTALATDRLWTTRPGVSPTINGQPCDYLTIAQLAAGFAANSIPAATINGLAAAVTANETAFAATSTTSITATNSGTSGHTPSFDVNWAAAPAATIPASAINGLAAAVTAGETAFAATSTGSTLVITAAGTGGHTPNLEVNFAGISAANANAVAGAIGADGVPFASVDFSGANADTDFAAAVAAAETTTTLAYNGGTSELTFTDEDGADTVINLSGLASDIFVTGASFAGTTLTLTDNDAGTADVTVDLAAFASSFVNNADGTYTLTSGDASTITIDTRAASNPIADAGGFFTGTTVEAALQEAGAALAAAAGVSTDANNDITAGGDGGAFLDVSAAETTTTFAQANATGVITYTDEDGGNHTATVLSTDANQLLIAGADGGAFLTAPTTQLP